MYIYVLNTYWNSPDNEGNEILGVYSEDHLDEARSVMRDEASRIREEYPPDIWEEDYTWETEDEIHMGFDPKQVFELATVYCWEITSHEVV